MKRCALLLSFLFALAISQSFACGDKVLALGRAIKLRYMASHSIAMLVYAQAGSPTAAAMSDPNLQSALKKSSQVLKLVANPAELSQVLSRGKYDVILADAADAAGITQQVESMASHTVVVPVLYQGTKSEASKLAKQYHVVLKSPAKTGSYMSALDEAIEIKAVRDQTRIIAKK